jgi:DNA polymerase/3'-5' exonuclease PolX
MKLQDAESIAQDLLTGNGQLASHFEKWTVCGSIRRKKSEVNDIDIVAIEKPHTRYQFGEPTISQRIKRLDPTGESEAKAMGKQGAARFLDGDKIKRFQYRGMMIDLYLADEKTYGTLVLIRTGSKDHNVRLTTLAMGKGWKLFASGQGLCRVGKTNRDMILEVIDSTEDGILLKLLGRVPKPEERN